MLWSPHHDAAPPRTASTRSGVLLVLACAALQAAPAASAVAFYSPASGSTTTSKLCDDEDTAGTADTVLTMLKVVARAPRLDTSIYSRHESAQVAAVQELARQLVAMQALPDVLADINILTTFRAARCNPDEREIMSPERRWGNSGARGPGKQAGAGGRSGSAGAPANERRHAIPTSAGNITSDSKSGGGIRFRTSRQTRRLQEPQPVPGAGAPCPNPPAVLQAPSKKRGVLNYTGGYSDNVDCGWQLRCGDGDGNGEVLLFSFTQFHIHGYHSYVSLFNGSSAAAPPLGPRLRGPGHRLSPRVGQLFARQFGASAGELLVSFHSDYYGDYDGFAGEYWCAPANTVALGCTDPLASNYDPKARFYAPCGVVDKERQKAALLGAFVGHEDWTGIRSGWTQASADPCASGARWEGLTCDGDGRVTGINLSYKSGVRGQLYGPALAQLRIFAMELQNTQLSGTLPPSVGKLTALILMRFWNTQLSGTLPPSVGKTGLVAMDLMDTQLSGTLPPSVGNLMALERIILSNARLSGTLPALGGCDRLTYLDATSNSFTGLPASLPPGLSHIYLGLNPMRGEAADLSAALRGVRTLAALDVSLLNVGLSVGCGTVARDPNSCKGSNGEFLDGFPEDFTHVASPQNCHVGSGSCAFTLQLYDNDGRAARTGGLVSGLELGKASGTAGGAGGRMRMVDNRDGTFSGTVNASWVTSKGPHTFSFWLNGTDISDGIHYDAVTMLSTSAVSLRTVDFAPVMCPLHMQPNETGGACLCKPHFTRETTAAGQGPSCRRLCPDGTKITAAGDGCECDGTSYNATATGILLCNASRVGDRQALLHDAPAGTGQHCRPCPDQCATCESGYLTLSRGWWLGPSTHRAVPPGVSTRTAFRCAYKNYCNQTNLSITTYDSIHIRNSTCAQNRTGPLCSLCPSNFYQLATTSCEICPHMDHSKIWLGILVGVLMFGVLFLVLNRLHSTRAQVYNKLPTIGSSNIHWLCFCCASHLDIYTLAVIMFGWMQVLSLLPSILEIPFPTLSSQVLTTMSAMFTTMSALTANIEVFFGISHVACLGFPQNELWYLQWLTHVLAIPGSLSAAIWALYLTRVWRARSQSSTVMQQAQRRAAKNRALVQLSFLTALFYPQVAAKVLSALRCRQFSDRAADSYLAVDYSVKCTDHIYVQWIRPIAWVMTLVAVVGFPLALLVFMFWGRRRRHKRWAESQAPVVSRQNSNEMALMNAAATTTLEHTDAWALEERLWRTQGKPSFEEYNYARLKMRFSFLVDRYQPAVFWFEPVDMLRKLVLSGALQFMHRGTAMQTFTGCTFAFLSFGMQVYLQPYADREANILKAMVDAQIFWTFLISFIIRVLPNIDTEEPFDADSYSRALALSVLVLLLAFCMLACMPSQSSSMHEPDDHESDLSEEPNAISETNSLVVPRPRVRGALNKVQRKVQPNAVAQNEAMENCDQLQVSIEVEHASLLPGGGAQS